MMTEQVDVTVVEESPVDEEDAGLNANSSRIPVTQPTSIVVFKAVKNNCYRFPKQQGWLQKG